MKGFYVAQEAHVAHILESVNLSGGKNSQVFSMKTHQHVSIIIGIGVSAAVGAITVEECDDFVPTNHTAIAFDVYKQETANLDVLGAKVSVTSAGFTPSLNDNIFYVIEIDAQQLDDGKPNLRVVFADPSGNCQASAVAILSGSRYASDQSATVLS